MAILEKKVSGKSYFYEVKSYREDGKVKQRILRYFGRTDPRENPKAKPIVKHSICATYRFGEVALILHCAKKIKFIETVNKYMPKRQGLSHGLLLFLLAAHRLTGEKPSSRNLPDWSKKTFLPMPLNFNPAKITRNNIAYTMDCIISEGRGIDYTFHIAKDLYEHARAKLGGGDEIYFYDLTSTYFEGRSCPLARFGYSRDGLSDKLQINIGLVVDKTFGLPLMTKVFEGNINDCTTVYEMIYYAKFILKKDRILLIMDRGMDSEDNIRIIDTTGNDYIIGMSNKHGFVKRLKLRTSVEDGNWQSISVDNNREILLQKFTKNIFGKRRYILLYYHEEKALNQKETRDRNIAFAEQELKEIKDLTMSKAKDIVKGISKYLKIEKKDSRIVWKRDQVEINRAEQLDGKFCMATNKNLCAKDIYMLYFSKDKVEKAFRHMKQDLDLHPTRKRIPDRVRADVFICHLAYLLLRIAETMVKQKKMDISWDVLLSETKEIRLLEYKKCSGNSDYNYITNNEIQKNIVNILGLWKYVPVSTTNPK